MARFTHLVVNENVTNVTELDERKGNDFLCRLKSLNAKQDKAQILLVTKKRDFDFLPHLV